MALVGTGWHWYWLALVGIVWHWLALVVAVLAEGGGEKAYMSAFVHVHGYNRCCMLVWSGGRREGELAEHGCYEMVDLGQVSGQPWVGFWLIPGLYCVEYV